MDPRPLTMSASFLEMVRGFQELHRLRAAGQEDSPEADAVRDAADAPWYALTETEKERIGGLSEDLYSITDPPKSAPRELNPQVQSRLNEVDQARQRGEWDRALQLLRRWAGYIEPSFLSYLRGTIWLGAGDPRTAAIFLEHAVGLQPENDKYLRFFLNALARFDPAEATRRAEPVLEAPGRYKPEVVTQAASIVFDSTWDLSPTEASGTHNRLITILESTLEKIEQGDGEELNRSVFTEVCVLLGLCHEFLGESQAALSIYSRGIAVDPGNEILRVARGAVLYGEGRGAVEDLEWAVQSGSTSIWPYSFLAHHNLLVGQFDRCRQLSERALEMEGPDALKSELAEWLAIAQAKLGCPADVVRRSFDRSIDFNPANERARRNLAAFEVAVQPVSVGAFEMPNRDAVRAMCLSERRHHSQPAA